MKSTRSFPIAKTFQANISLKNYGLLLVHFLNNHHICPVKHIVKKVNTFKTLANIYATILKRNPACT